MSAPRPVASLESLIRWCKHWRENAEKTRQDTVPLVSLDTLIQGLGAIHADIAERELALIRREAGLGQPVTQPGDRLDAAYAERMVRDCLPAMNRLYLLAAETATKQALPQVQRDARYVLDTLETLCTGVTRPDFNPEETPHTGA